VSKILHLWLLLLHSFGVCERYVYILLHVRPSTVRCLRSSGGYPHPRHSQHRSTLSCEIIQTKSQKSALQSFYYTCARRQCDVCVLWADTHTKGTIHTGASYLLRLSKQNLKSQLYSHFTTRVLVDSVISPFFGRIPTVKAQSTQ